jgi:ketopantoate hydroxymethyltransferase
VKRYADLGEQTVAAARAYADEVQMGRFPVVSQRVETNLLVEAK